MTVYRFQQKSEGKVPRDKRLSWGHWEFKISTGPGVRKGTRTRCHKDTLSQGHATAGSPRTLDPEIKEDHVTLTGTHRLRALGITSPFDLPEDPYYLFELIAIVLNRRIHFLSVIFIFFKYYSEPLSLTLRATNDRTVRANLRITGAQDSLESRLHSPHPSVIDKEGGPGREHLPESSSNHALTRRLIREMHFVF